MSNLGTRERILVKDVMTTPAIAVNENACIPLVAQLMEQHKVGCVMVTSKNGKPLGIITERDLVTRVLSVNIKPNKLTAEKVMTSPLITVDPNVTLSEAARRMSRLNIRRLGVMYKGDLVGIVSSKDILAVTPELIQVLREKTRIEGVEVEGAPEHPPMAGYCDQCGNWSDALKEVNGNFICEECRFELEVEY